VQQLADSIRSQILLAQGDHHFEVNKKPAQWRVLGLPNGLIQLVSARYKNETGTV
jgi:hypothetical protein